MEAQTEIIKTERQKQNIKVLTKHPFFTSENWNFKLELEMEPNL
jgi:hypothetical protein